MREVHFQSEEWITTPAFLGRSILMIAVVRSRSGAALPLFSLLPIFYTTSTISYDSISNNRKRLNNTLNLRNRS